MDNSNTYAVMEFIGEKLLGGSWKGGEGCKMGRGRGRGRGGESSVPGEVVVTGESGTKKFLRGLAPACGMRNGC